MVGWRMVTTVKKERSEADMTLFGKSPSGS